LTAESGWQGGESPFPPIADYGFLSDCQCNALVAPSGAVEWMCVPRPDSPSVFAAILDRGAGTFRVGPAEVMVPVSRRYLPGTLVLETTWKTRTGWLSVRDTLLVGGWHLTSPSPEWRRTPGDFAAEHCLVRTACSPNSRPHERADKPPGAAEGSPAPP
jgi:alpha,alpha-trehalase